MFDNKARFMYTISIIVTSFFLGQSIFTINPIEENYSKLNKSDTTIPIVKIISPIITQYDNNQLLLQIEATDDNKIDKIWYNWNGKNVTYTSAIRVVFREGLNTIDAWAKDKAGNVGSASVTFLVNTLDKITPDINILNPISTTYFTKTILLAISSPDNDNIDTIWYEWNGTINYYENPVYVTFNEGSNTIYVWGNDSSGNIGIDFVTFFIDTTDKIPPTVTIISPIAKNYSNTLLLLNISAVDNKQIDKIWYNWRGTNLTYTSSVNITGNEGFNTIYVWATDQAGNLGSSSVTFYITSINNNTISPIVVINNPNSGIYNTSKLLVEITATSNIGINSIWYNWDGENVKYTSPVYISFKLLNNTLTAYANDTQGKIGFTSVNFYINSSNIITPSGNGFISVWDTTKTSTYSSDTKQVKLPLVSDGIYSFTVKWGDGKSDHITSYSNPAKLHTYSSPGLYTINITGTIIGWSFGRDSYKEDCLKLCLIQQWGDLHLGNSGYYFFNCENLKFSTTDCLQLEGTTNLRCCFYGCKNIDTIGRLNDWDVTHVTNMESMFADAKKFNQYIGNWDVSNVLKMGALFYGTSFNQPIGYWNVSRVTEMWGMFERASLFNQYIGDWDVSHVVSMGNMFESASSFNQYIGDWDVSQVTDMSQMFCCATKFNQDISKWDTSNVDDMLNMFFFASSFNQNIGDWNVSKVTVFNMMFGYASNFDQDLGKWNVASAVQMCDMFYEITLSTENYDSLLIGWSTKNLPMRMKFNGGYSKFSSGEAAKARSNIINKFGWEFIDGGQAN